MYALAGGIMPVLAAGGARQSLHFVLCRSCSRFVNCDQRYFVIDKPREIHSLLKNLYASLRFRHELKHFFIKLVESLVFTNRAIFVLRRVGGRGRVQ